MPPQLVEVRFKGNRKAFYRWHEPEPLRSEEAVIVETERGLDWGRVAATGAVASLKCERCQARLKVPAPPVPPVPPSPAPQDDAAPENDADKALDEAAEESSRPSPAAPEPERRVVRRATAADTRLAVELRRSEDDVRRKVRERAASFHLAMKVSDAEWQWDRNKLTVYFTAERRVDFRNLVRELASLFRTRIELRQIGVRDEAKRLDGIGRCGRQLCCTWLPELRPIGLAIAKDQSLSLNPTQISGPCGRLLCCLRHEHDFYVQSRKRFPKEGRTLATARGSERVLAVDIFRERVTLKAEDGSTRIVPLADLRREVETAEPPPPLPPPPSAPTPPPPPSEAAAAPGPEAQRASGAEGGRRRRGRRRRRRR